MNEAITKRNEQGELFNIDGNANSMDAARSRVCNYASPVNAQCFGRGTGILGIDYD